MLLFLSAQHAHGIVWNRELEEKIDNREQAKWDVMRIYWRFDLKQRKKCTSESSMAMRKIYQLGKYAANIKHDKRKRSAISETNWRLR